MANCRALQSQTICKGLSWTRQTQFVVIVCRIVCFCEYFPRVRLSSMQHRRANIVLTWTVRPLCTVCTRELQKVREKSPWQNISRFHVAWMVSNFQLVVTCSCMDLRLHAWTFGCIKIKFLLNNILLQTFSANILKLPRMLSDIVHLLLDYPIRVKAVINCKTQC